MRHVASCVISQEVFDRGNLDQLPPLRHPNRTRPSAHHCRRLGPLRSMPTVNGANDNLRFVWPNASRRREDDLFAMSRIFRFF